MQQINTLVLLFLCGALASCGWHLRSSEQTGSTINSLYVGAELAAHERGPDSMIQGFDKRLRELDIESSKSISEAQLGLIIVSESSDERVLSLTSDLFEQQSRLSKTVVYQVWRENERIVDSEEVSTYRDITQDQSNAAAKNRETDLISVSYTHLTLPTTSRV